MVRQSVTRDGNVFVQYGGAFGAPRGASVEDLEKMRQQASIEKAIDAQQAELEAEERQINALYQQMMRAEMLAGKAVTPARAMAIKQTAVAQIRRKNALPDVGNNSSMTLSDVVDFLKPTVNPQDVVNPLGPRDRKPKEPKQRQDDSSFDWSGGRPQEERTGSATSADSGQGSAAGADSGQVRAGIASLDKDRNSLLGASSLDRIRILEAMQMDANLQELVLAGLMDWNDIMSKNTGKVVAPDGTVPDMVVDEKKLEALQSRLLAIGAQQQQTERVQLRRRAKQRATPGPKPGDVGFFGKKDVYMPPRYLPGELPGLKNKVLV